MTNVRQLPIWNVSKCLYLYCISGCQMLFIATLKEWLLLTYIYIFLYGPQLLVFSLLCSYACINVNFDCSASPSPVNFVIPAHFNDHHHLCYWQLIITAGFWFSILKRVSILNTESSGNTNLSKINRWINVDRFTVQKTSLLWPTYKLWS